MMIKICYSKLVHHFFFLWHISRGGSFHYKEYTNDWLKITGQFTKKEKEVIRKFKSVFQKQSKDILDSIFVKKKIENKEIREVFEITEAKFQKIWDIVENDLPKAKNNLINLIKDNLKTFKLIIKKLKIFYNVNNVPEKTIIYIILLPQTIKSGGGKFIPKNNIILEGNLKRFNNKKTLAILLHEMIHLYLEAYLKQQLYPKFHNKIEYHPLKELIAGTLLPEGYLSYRFLNLPIKKTVKEQKLVKLVEQYIESGAKIDTTLIRQCILFYKNKKVALINN